jgi:isochorismate hydrolase
MVRNYGGGGQNSRPDRLDLVEPLAALARSEEVLDKPTNSMFGASDLTERLAARNADTLVVTGADVRVLATVLPSTGDIASSSWRTP